MRNVFAITVAAMAVAMPAAAMAQYPERDVRVVVPWGAGGGTDAISRKIMSLVDEQLPVAAYVENIDGGLTSIGLSRVMSAPADGYTLGILTYDSIITVPWQGLLASYDLEKLDYVARITTEANALMVRGDSGYETFDDLIEAAINEPNSIRLAVTSVGGMPYLSMAQLEEETGADFREVTYPDGSAGQLEALVSGEVDAAITSLGDFSGVLQSGEVVGLVEFSGETNPLYSDVPISSEVGLDMETGSFIIVAVPAGTPDNVTDTLRNALFEAYNSQDFAQWADSVGVTRSWLEPEAVESWIEETQAEIFERLDGLEESGALER